MESEIQQLSGGAKWEGYALLLEVPRWVCESMGGSFPLSVETS